MKKTLLLLVAMLSTAIAFAQSPAQPFSSQNIWNDRPDVIIKGEELKNFPGAELTEMLYGRLPGLDQLNLKVLTVTFIVDGVVWPAIDALSIHNIEEIAYYRGGLNSKFGVQNTSPGGVIYITTKTATFQQPLNATFNALLGTSSLKRSEGKDHSTLQSYQAALAQGTDKFGWRAAATYNRNTRNLTRFDFMNQFQLNADLRFTPWSWMELGVNANYAPAKGDSQVDKQTAPTLDTKFKNKQNNWNGSFYIKAAPLKGVVNETRFQKNSIVSDFDTYTVSETGLSEGTRSYHENLLNSNYRNFTILDELSYRFNLHEEQIKVKASAIFQYNETKSKTDFRSASYRSNTGWSGISDPEMTNVQVIEMGAKTYSLVGDLSVDFYSLLSVKTGVRRDSYTQGNIGKAFYAPYVYADVSLKQLMLKDVKVVSDFLIFGSYGQYRSEIPLDLNTVAGITLNGTAMMNSNFGTGSEKSNMKSFGAKAALFDRITLSGDWYQNNNYLVMFIPVTPGNIYTVLPVKYNGWRIWSNADVFRGAAFKWNMGLNVFKNKTKIDLASAGIKLENDPNSSAAIQAGMQQNFSYANFFLNMNGNAYFDRLLFITERTNSGVRVSANKADFINLNFLSFGYNFKEQLDGKTWKSLNVSLVARNLLQKKKHLEDYQASKTIGLAISAGF